MLTFKNSTSQFPHDLFEPVEAAEGDIFIVRVIRKLGDMNLSGGLSSFYIVPFILQVLMQLIIPFLHIMMYQLLVCYEETEREEKKKTKQVDWKAWTSST